MVIINMNNKFKKGFSLFEAFVVMLIVAIFVALMANTVAHRPKEKVASEAHGRFECYYDSSGKLYQQMYTEGSTTGRTKATKKIEFEKEDGSKELKTVCEFTPPSYAKYLIFDAVGGGAGGSPKGGASEGQFVSTFYASIERKYYILPGQGGKREHGANAAENGEVTIIKNQDKEIMITAEGGKALSSLENTTVNDVLDCSITEWCTLEQFDCQITPTCRVVDGKIEVSYCRSKGTYVTKQLTYKYNRPSDGEVEMGNPRFIVNNVYTTNKNANTWIYHDISQFSDYNDKDLDPTESYKKARPDWYPNVNDVYAPSMYTMELLMNTSADGDEPNPSNLHRLIESMQYESGIKDANVGQGGGKNQDGSAGGALILW